MLYLYAIADAGAAVPDEGGLDEQPLRRVVEGVLAAVCSEHHHHAPPEPSTEAVRRHAAVVEALAAAGPVLPARFGSVFVDAPGVRRRLAERADELVAALALVRGRVELGVRVLESATPDTAAPAADGRSYLLARLERQRRTAALADELHGALAAHAAAATVRATPVPPLLLSGAYLVEREAVEPFRERVEALAAERPDLAVVCTGPWPPYSFAAPDGEGA